MSQQRITIFFPRLSQKRALRDSRCLFIELPASIRLRIYYEAGIVSGETIHLNYWRSRKKEGTSPEGDNKDLPTLPLNLFTVCRSVYNELRKVLYGDNRLVVSRKAPRGLRVLERLSASTLLEIRFLVIRLNVSSCESRCCGDRGQRCGNNHWHSCLLPSSHNLPLSSSVDQLVILQWTRLCMQLASGVQPSSLALYVTCDCNDATTAQMIAQSLRLLPALQDCGLRLAIYMDEGIKSITKDTAMHLTRNSPPPPPAPFRFLDLPKEIQLHILTYPSLAPLAEIICTQKRLRYWEECPTRGAIADMPIVGGGLLKCFCTAAHSAFGFRCRCGDLASPFTMFRVSREFRDLTTEAFYGQNSFVVLMDQQGSLPRDIATISLHPDVDREGQVTEPLFASIVPGLASFPSASIGFLTSVCLRFQGSDLEHLQPNQAGWDNWLRTIHALSQKANLASLTLQIQMCEKFYPDFDDPKVSFSPIYEAFMRRTYANLVLPMKGIAWTAKEFVHLLKLGHEFWVPGWKARA